MPEDSSDKSEPKLTPESNSDVGLKNSTPGSSPTMEPIPSVEQEPQTIASAPVAPVATGERPAAGAFASPQPMTGSPNGKKKKWIIGGVVAGVLALLLGGGAFAYFAYQNPDKVIADGFVNLFHSQPRSMKGTISVENNEATVKATVDVKSNDKVANGTLTAAVTMKSLNQTFNGAIDFAATVDGDGYIKANGLDELADQYADTVIKAQEQQYKAYGMTITESQKKEFREQLLLQVEPVIKKINNRWIKFDTKANDDTSEQQKCVTDAFKKLQSDRALRDELAKAYGDNKFINVKEQLGVKDGSYGYVLDFDSTKAKSFGDAAEKTAFFKELQKCDGFSSSSNSSSTNTIKNGNDDKVRIELWVSQWSHQITALNIEGTDTSSPMNETKLSFKFDIGYTNDDSVAVPKDAVDFNDLQKELEQLSPMGGSATTSSSVSI